MWVMDWPPDYDYASFLDVIISSDGDIILFKTDGLCFY